MLGTVISRQRTTSPRLVGVSSAFLCVLTLVSGVAFLRTGHDRGWLLVAAAYVFFVLRLATWYAQRSHGPD
jgi:hypothetical protein